MAKATETPLEMAVLTILAVIAVCAAKVFSIRLGPSHVEPLNIWTLVAMEPGTRKTPVMNLAKWPLEAWETTQAKALGPLIEDAEARLAVGTHRIKALEARANKVPRTDLGALLDEIKEEKALLPTVPTLPRLLAGDVTPEQLAQMLAVHGERMGLFSDEGGFFGNIGGRYNSGMANLDVVLKAFSGSSERVDRIGRPSIILQAPALSLCLTPQPTVLQRISTEFLGRGLMDRFLYAIPPSRVGYRTLISAPIPEQTKEAYGLLVSSLLRLRGSAGPYEGQTPPELRLSDDAVKAWKDFERWVETEMRPGNRLEFVKGWASKLPGTIGRVAGLFHLIEHAHENPAAFPVSQDSMDRAVRLAMQLMPHALVAYDTFGADPNLEAARKLWAWIERQKVATFKARDAFNGLRGQYKKMEDLAPAFKVLSERFYIREADLEHRRGRPSPAYEVNPLLLPPR